jgi:hypothetical protein
MRFAFYCGVLLVAAASVVFGLDWMPAPMPPMPDIKNVVFVPPPPPAPPRVAQPAVPSPSPNSTSPVAPPPQAPVAAQNPSLEAASAPPPVAAAPPPKCDVDACARAYRSFQESDCTYNPSSGPRRLCTKGDPEKYAREHAMPAAPTASPPEAPVPAQSADPNSIVTPEAGTSPATAAPAPAAPRCNVSACAAAYPRSFRESDCTFNPSSGPRKVCEK